MDIGYSRLAEHWDEFFPPDAERHRYLSRLLAGPPSDSTILDLGCGTGATAYYLAERGMQVTAVDPDPAMIRLALERLNGAASTAAGKPDYRPGDMLGALRAVPADSVGGVLCLGNTLPHLETRGELEDFLDETRRVLTDEGVLVIQILDHGRILENGGIRLQDLEADGLTFRREYLPASDGRYLRFITEVETDGRTDHREIFHLVITPEDLIAAAHEAGLRRTVMLDSWSGGMAESPSGWLAMVFSRAD